MTTNLEIPIKVLQQYASAHRLPFATVEDKIKAQSRYRDLFTIIFLTTCATLFFVWWVKEVLIPTWDEKALKKEESQRASIKNSFAAPRDMPKSGKEFIRVNDSDIYPDWGEGPESTDEIK